MSYLLMIYRDGKAPYPIEFGSLRNAVETFESAKLDSKVDAIKLFDSGHVIIDEYSVKHTEP